MKTFLLWGTGLALTIFFGGFLVVLYGSHERSPDFDPVIFDYSDRKPDGSSEKNPEDIFYVPARYWTYFPSEYKEECKNSFFRLIIDSSNPEETEQENMKSRVVLHVAKSIGWLARVDMNIDKIKNKEPKLIIAGVKIFTFEVDEKKRKNPQIFYQFKGFDNKDVVGYSYQNLSENKTEIMGINIFRRINSKIEIEYSLTFKNISEIYDKDKQITMYIKSLQIPPSSFIRLK